ncbi:ERCC4 domain-containing protein [Daejeonella sp.]|uniref:ERCC4 domain-containing protein n=1 Tax=Daejeonella sp. TaxID=2805397 RepID=UPI002727E314|nr:ERCC4 domain-containing protein [Daejeonella sp.]MDO8993543.1 ERCC4 domain-containing protein [Daejeonella sp.]MDP2414630.1 ERCC4 domain-containing protein [Daejeonella sp.]
MFTIKIDNRECNEILLRVFKNKKDTTIQFCRLQAGGYQVNDYLLVERKTITDLSASIKDGRLFQQAGKLASVPMQSMIILEGTSSMVQSLGLTWEAIQGALVTLSLVFKIPLLRSRNPEETARLILYAARQVQSYGYKQLYPRPFPYARRLKDKYKRQIHVLQGLPGIGPARASLLLDKFGTLKAIFNSSVHELEQISGIGRNTARQINRIIE